MTNINKSRGGGEDTQYDIHQPSIHFKHPSQVNKKGLDDGYQEIPEEDIESQKNSKEKIKSQKDKIKCTNQPGCVVKIRIKCTRYIELNNKNFYYKIKRF